MTCKFKYGDRVTVISSPSLHKGKIISISLKSFDRYVCRVEFDNRFLIPSEMNYYDNELELESGATTDHCPVCKTDWTVTKFGKKTWKDCSKCGKKEEDIISMKVGLNTDFTDKTKPPGVYSDSEDLLKEFEKILGADDDDQDDFGYYTP